MECRLLKKLSGLCAHAHHTPASRPSEPRARSAAIRPSMATTVETAAACHAERERGLRKHRCSAFRSSRCDGPRMGRSGTGLGAALLGQQPARRHVYGSPESVSDAGQGPPCPLPPPPTGSDSGTARPFSTPLLPSLPSQRPPYKYITLYRATAAPPSPRHGARAMLCALSPPPPLYSLLARCARLDLGSSLLDGWCFLSRCLVGGNGLCDSKGERLVRMQNFTNLNLKT